jgi:hypothetical protein
MRLPQISKQQDPDSLPPIIRTTASPEKVCKFRRKAPRKPDENLLDESQVEQSLQAYLNLGEVMNSA